MKKYLTLLLLFSTIVAFSQEGSDTTSAKGVDVGIAEISVPFVTQRDNYQSNIPTIELNIGNTMPKYKESVISDNFTESNIIDVKIGFTDMFKVSGTDKILEEDFNYIHISRFDKLSNTDEAGPDLNVRAWQIGLGNLQGYGWRTGGNSSVTMYNASSMVWTNLNFEEEQINSENSSAINVFDDRVRFGSKFEAGVKARLIDNIGIQVAYERSHIFPHHKVWYWLGSEIVQGIGNGLASVFIDAVKKSSPALVPIVDFIFRNGISYGMYELRSKKMNWPFNTVPPFEFESFKLGTTFYF